MLNPFICCFQVDGYKYFMQCKEEAAVCAREIRHKCVCNTFTQYSRACASQDVVLKWRTDKFCREWLGLLDTFSRLFSPNSIREWDSNHVPRWSQPATQPIEVTAQKAGKGRLLLSQLSTDIIWDTFSRVQHHDQLFIKYLVNLTLRSCSTLFEFLFSGKECFCNVNYFFVLFVILWMHECTNWCSNFHIFKN